MAMSLAKLDVELEDPLHTLDDLNSQGLEQLQEDIDSYIHIERRNNGNYLEFWTSLKEIVNAERRKRRSKDTGIHKAVMADVQQMFYGKTSVELKELQDDIRKSIRDGRRTDVEYWGLMETEVGLERCRAIVRETYDTLLEKQLEILGRLREELAKQKLEDAKLADDRPNQSSEYRFIDSGSAEASLQYGNVPDANNVPKTSAHRDAEYEGDDSEEKMNPRDEVQLPGSTYWWQDKYRPRKPQYFNRVKTGYDWNKYNSTHYDRDNPPPKVVQGYKFNIFFPDLIDNTVTPKYYLEAADQREFAIIRFHSGPPYEDIAFKIVNQEWDINRRAGFKCVFERGVLQLHFNFKRHWYRR
jgi:hypothetical protein